MGERQKHNMKDCRLNSNNGKNGHRNYGPMWDYRRKEEFNRYRYYEQEYDSRQSVNQRPDLRTYYPSPYRHLNNSEGMWNNVSGTDATSTYYNLADKYSEQHRSNSYLQHQNNLETHIQPDYIGLATASRVQQTNVTWQQQNNRNLHGNKRRQDSDRFVSCSHNFIESNHKSKKKKPLSQNVPTKREWTIDDAKKAIHVEMEFSKRFKRNSLMIKFPDIDINKEIVSKFHTAIENVHFQQPSTARYCFVTLNDNADGDLVIKTLNTTKFGHGYLTAEYKKERDNQIVSPEDIDPLTLYVGNLAQEITKQDLEQIYTKKKRIDIGFAMKMKKTRYAFISFWNVEDSIEAYTRTRSDVLYSKSLIVRFRRLHGTVGLPGEPKLQNPPKSTNINHTDQRNEDANSSSDERSSADPRFLADKSDCVEEDNSIDANCEENLIKNISSNSCEASKPIDDHNKTLLSLKTKSMKVDLSLVKQEDPDDISHDKESNIRVQDLKSDIAIESDIKPSRYQFESPFLPSYVINELMIQHKPIKEELAPETSIGQVDVPPHTEEQKAVQSSKSGSNNSRNENFVDFEMDMVSSVDFISIYKSIQPKPSSWWTCGYYGNWRTWLKIDRKIDVCKANPCC